MIRKKHVQIIIALAIVALCVFESNIFDKKPEIQLLHGSLTSMQLKSLWEKKEFEIPNQASTRTGFSSKSFEQLQTWIAYQENLKNKISRVGKINILFYGDSITESIIGTSYGNQCITDEKRCRDIPEVWVLSANLSDTRKLFSQFPAVFLQTFSSTLQKHNLTSHVSAISGGTVK